MAHSPASSPRLPSPPPMAEDQVGATSPSANASQDYSDMDSAQTNEHAASRRILPGTRSEDMHEGPPLVDLQDIDSAFQLTEHLKALHASYTRPASEPNAIIPIDRKTALALAKAPSGVDNGIWLYELCRFLTQKANAIVVGLFTDDPPCSSNTCPEMRASEWQYLCAAHDPPKSCCAIDYCCHTLDWAATQLTSSKLFPSRLALGTENVGSGPQLRKMTEIFRRVYRIFAHAWFQHREVFWRVEMKTGLYVFFKTVCDEYRLIPEDNYTIPAEAEGIETTPIAQVSDQSQPTLLKKENGSEASMITEQPAGNATLATGNTTKRHRGLHDRTTSVSTVIHEEVEEDEEDNEEAQEVQDEQPQRGVVKEVEPAFLAVEPAEPPAVVTEEEMTADQTEAVPQETTEEPATKTKSAETEGAAPVEEEPVVEPMDTETSPAADESEATKTVAD